MTKRTGSLTRSLTVDVLTTLDAADRIIDEWDALADRCNTQPFGRPAMALAWWRHLGKGSLHIVTVRSAGGDLVGLAPLHLRSFPAANILRPLGHGAGAVATFLIAPIKADVAGVLASTLVANGSSTHSAAHLADLPVDDSVLRFARRSDDFDVDARLHDECPTITLSGLDDAQALLASPSHAKLRKQLARSERDLGDRAWSVDIATEQTAVLAAFDRVGSLFDAAEADRPRLHFGHGNHGAFFTEALGSLAERNQVALLTLLIDDQPAAFDVHVLTNATSAAAILGRFHPEHAGVSPGHLLLRSGVDWAIEQGLDQIDLQLGNDPYKTSWANDGYDTVEVVMAGSGRATLARASIDSVELAFHLRQRGQGLATEAQSVLRRITGR